MQNFKNRISHVMFLTNPFLILINNSLKKLNNKIEPGQSASLGAVLIETILFARDFVSV